MDDNVYYPIQLPSSLEIVTDNSKYIYALIPPILFFLSILYVLLYSFFYFYYLIIYLKFIIVTHIRPLATQLYKKGELTEEMYKKKYFDKLSLLRKEEILEKLKVFSIENGNRDIVLLCYERSEDFCHILVTSLNNKETTLAHL